MPLRLSLSRVQKIVGIASLLLIVSSVIFLPQLSRLVFGSQPTITVNLTENHGIHLAGATVQGFMETAKAGKGATGITDVFSGATGSDGRLVIADFSKIIAISNDWVSYQGTSAKYFSPRVLLFITYSDANGSVYFEQDSVPLITLDFLNHKSATVNHSMDLSRPLPHVKLPKLVTQTPVTTSMTGAQMDSTTTTPFRMDLPNPNPYGTTSPWWQANGTYGPYPSTCCSNIPVAWGQVSGGAYASMSASILAAHTDDVNAGYAIGSGFSMSGPSYYSGSTVSSFQNQATFGQTVNLNMCGGSGCTPSPSTGEIWLNGQMEGDAWYQMACNGTNCGPTGLDLFMLGAVNMQVSSSGIVQGGWDYNLPSYSLGQGFVQNFYFTQIGGQYTGDGNGTPTSNLFSYQLTAQWVGNQLQWYANMFLTGLELIPLLPAQIASSIGGVVGNLVAPMGTLSTGNYQSWWQYDAPIGQQFYTSAWVSNAAWQVSGSNNCGGICYVPLEGYRADSFGRNGGGGCVLSGTSITLADGTHVPVDNIRTSQKVLSYNTSTGTLMTTTVYNNTAIQVNQIVDVNNGLLYASGFHDQPIYVQLQNGTRTWIELGQLQNGMKLFQPVSGTWISVTNIQDLTGNFTVYDLRTANAQINNYIANGVLLDKKV